MATSGTVTFSVNELEVITDALENIGAIGAGETLQPEDITTARRKLNMLLKQWVSQIDFAPGLKMWTRRRAYLFPQQGQVSYSLGPSGDNATESYLQTTTAQVGAVSQDHVHVTSAAGLTVGMNFGVVLDSGSVHWTTISSIVSTQIFMADVLPSRASVGNVVFAYTTKMRRPFELLTGVRRDIDGNDTPIDIALSLDDYETIGDKTQESTISSLYFEAQRTNAVVYTNCAPSDVTEVIRFVYLSYIEDMTAQTQDFDLPAEWFRAVSSQLSLDLCPTYEVEPPSMLLKMAQESLAMAKRAYPDNSQAYYQTDPDCY